MLKRSILICTALAAPSIAHAQEGSVTELDTRDNSAAVASADQPAPSGAPQAPQAQSSSDSDIVVTARRREERLQEVPMSVSAIPAASLASAGVSNAHDLTQVVPGVVFAQAGATVQPSIRGVGNRSTGRSNDPSVAIYIDGFYYPSTAGLAFDLLELQRVEVLRGPQGTLFGRNATGGLINYITVDPQFETRGSVSLRAGSFGELSGRAYITGAISDTIAADLAVSAYRDDGYITDLINGGHANDRTAFSIRSKWLFQVSEHTRLTLTGAYNDVDDPTAQTYQPLNQNTRGRFLSPILPTRPWQTATSAATPIRIGYSQAVATARLTHDFEGLTLFFEGSYQGDHSPNSADSDGSTAVLAASSATHAGVHAKTAEVRLVSTGSGPFQWVAGVFGFQAYSWTLPQISPTFTNQVRVREARLYGRNWTRSLAGFLELNYSITPALRATLGGRYTYEDRHFNARQDTVTLATGATTILAFDGTISFQRFTPRAVLQYIFSPRANIYASYNRGFKSGFFNTTSVTGASVEPEDLDAYEVGFHTEPVPGVLLNGAAYYYNYQNLQVSARDPVSGLSTTQNAAQSRIKGAEIEMVASLGHGTRLRLGASYNHAVYTSFPLAQVTVPRADGAGNDQPFLDVSGNHLPRTPEFTANAGLEHTSHFRQGDLGIGLNAYYSSKNYYEPSNRITQNGYVLINGEISWQFSNGLRLAVWGTNLTNHAVLMLAVPSTNGDMVVYDQPRRIGGSIGYRF